MVRVPPAGQDIERDRQRPVLLSDDGAKGADRRHQPAWRATAEPRSGAVDKPHPILGGRSSSLQARHNVGPGLIMMRWHSTGSPSVHIITIGLPKFRNRRADEVLSASGAQLVTSGLGLRVGVTVHRTRRFQPSNGIIGFGRTT